MIIQFIVQLVNYTLALIMWLIVGRVVLSLFTGDRNNFIYAFFLRFTDPVYEVIYRIFPFTRIPSDRAWSLWGRIGGLAPLVAIFLIVILRLITVILLSGVTEGQGR